VTPAGDQRGGSIKEISRDPIKGNIQEDILSNDTLRVGPLIKCSLWGIWQHQGGNNTSGATPEEITHQRNAPGEERKSIRRENQRKDPKREDIKGANPGGLTSNNTRGRPKRVALRCPP